MFTAKNENGKKVHIDDTVKGEAYFCPHCGEKIIPRKGMINIHHFAHMKSSNCISVINERTNKNNKKSKWHREWQNRFSIEYNEILFEYDEKKHIADICCENVVVEFQHSPIQVFDFLDRNTVYTKCGKYVIWIFDLISEFKKENLTINNDYIVWAYPKNIFNKFSSFPQNVIVLLQLNDLEDEKCLYHIYESNERKTSFKYKYSFSINEFVKLVEQNNPIIEEILEFQKNHVIGEKEFTNLSNEILDYKIHDSIPTATNDQVYQKNDKNENSTRYNTNLVNPDEILSEFITDIAKSLNKIINNMKHGQQTIISNSQNKYYVLTKRYSSTFILRFDPITGEVNSVNEPEFKLIVHTDDWIKVNKQEVGIFVDK